ncbi:Uncharacterised protein [Vibrio cholerae]|nr:Uncharacterised protein [Vibrio cholerae]
MLVKKKTSLWRRCLSSKANLRRKRCGALRWAMVLGTISQNWLLIMLTTKSSWRVEMG